MSLAGGSLCAGACACAAETSPSKEVRKIAKPVFIVPSPPILDFAPQSAKLVIFGDDRAHSQRCRGPLVPVECCRTLHRAPRGERNAVRLRRRSALRFAQLSIRI